MFDLLIRNGTIVDGLGTPRYRGDVAIKDGRVAAIGSFQGSADRIIDAADLIVAPGFVDPHTHYDAQISWDATVSVSSWHGVTTVVTGNCGVGLAPYRPQDRAAGIWDLINVEGIPHEILSTIKWEWESFPEYMDAADRRGLAINLACLVPLAPLRTYVMGPDAASQRAATPAETAEIAQVLRQAMEKGAQGFSTSRFRQHIGFQGKPLATWHASHDELKAYCHVLRDLGRGTVAIALTQDMTAMSEEDHALLDLLLRESTRPVTFLGVIPVRGNVNGCWAKLKQLEPLIARGARPQVLTRAMNAQFNLKAPFRMASLPSWKQAFNQTPEFQKALYAKQEFRDAFRTDLKSKSNFSGNWDLVSVNTAFKPELRRFEEKTISQIAAEQKKDAIDAFLDLAIEDDLRTLFDNSELEEAFLAPFVNDKRTILGFGDGGAHLDMLCDSGYPTYLIGVWSRDRGYLSLEDAVRRVTSEPADVFGLSDRGRLAVDAAADITLFDYAKINSGKKTESRNDLPGGGRRLVMAAYGIEFTIVNGKVVFERGQHSGALPGHVLR